MPSSPFNREARLHRLHNQRRIASALIERIQTFLHTGNSFRHELAQLFRQQGKFGSRDRRLYKELIFTYLRYQPWLDPIRSDQSAFLDRLIVLALPTAEVRELYATLDQDVSEEVENRHRLVGKSDAELVELLPSWIDSHLSHPLSPEQLMTFFRRPPLWLRIQKGDAEAILDQCRTATRSSAEIVDFYSTIPGCIEAPADFPLAHLPAYEDGSVEIQDISSQVLLQLLPEQPSGRWLDACAGAGGKTLQLAGMLPPRGKVFAYDTRHAALRELESRRQRAGLNNIEVLASRPTESTTYDGVLIDAPCTGSGTWRRHPYLMRQMREKDVMTHSDRQFRILQQYAQYVAPGGLLVYCTCSLSRFENEWVAKSFLNKRPDFSSITLAPRFGLEDKGNGITVYPHHFNGDGLYITAFQKSPTA